MPDEPADGVQPEDPGQGATGTPDAPYAEYLNRIPEQVRGDVEPVFRDWDSNVTKRFQEHSEYRKSWEPYENLGVNRLSTDEVQWLMQFREALDSPQAIREWYEQVYAPQNGIEPVAPAPSASPAEPAGGSGSGSGSGEQFGYNEYVDPNVQMLEQKLSASLGPIQQRLEQFAQWQEKQEQSARMAEAERYVAAQVEELKTKHPDEFNEQMVEKLIAQYIESDPRNAVQRAFADWQAIRSQIEKDYVTSKVNQPAPAESGGVPNGAPEEIKTLAQAALIARERLRQSFSD